MSEIRDDFKDDFSKSSIIFNIYVALLQQLDKYNVGICCDYFLRWYGTHVDINVDKSCISTFTGLEFSILHYFTNNIFFWKGKIYRIDFTINIFIVNDL